MIGVGLESVGVEEFIEGKFFDGELFIDSKKESYKKLGFKRMGLMGIGGALFSKKSRDAAAKVNNKHFVDLRKEIVKRETRTIYGCANLI